MPTTLACILLFSLSVGSPEPGASKHPKQVGQSCVVESESAFVACPARSPFVLAEDGSAVLFTENCVGGPRLRSFDLDTGALSTVTPLAAPFYQIATIPDDEEHIFLATETGRSYPPRALEKLDMTTGTADEFDISSLASDGSLIVSPDGRYLATGADLECQRAGSNCGPTGVAIMSVEDGHVLYRGALPKPDPETGHWPQLRWVGTSLLVVAGNPHRRAEVLLGLERTEDRRWVRREVGRDTKLPPPSVGPRVFVVSGERDILIPLPCGAAGERIDVDPGTLFTPATGSVTTLEKRGVLVLLKSMATGVLGEDEIKVVVLRTKGPR